MLFSVRLREEMNILGTVDHESVIDALSERLRRKSAEDRKIVIEQICQEFADRTFYVLRATRILHGQEENGSYPWVCAEDYEQFISKLRDWAVQQSNTVAEWEEWEARIQDSRKTPPTLRRHCHLYSTPVYIWVNWKLDVLKVRIDKLLPLISQLAASQDYAHSQAMLNAKAHSAGMRAMEYGD